MYYFKKKITKSMKVTGTLGFLMSGGIFVRYCMRSDHKGRKLFYGFLLLYWSEHIYHLSSYVGLVYHLKCIIYTIGAARSLL